MLPEAAGRGQHFQARGHSFSLYGPTLSRQITFLFSCDKLACKRVYAAFSLNWPGLLAVKKSNERVTLTLDEERCIKEQIYFELLYDSCI